MAIAGDLNSATTYMYISNQRQNAVHRRGLSVLQLWVTLATILFAILDLSACSRDPNVRKQKFVTQGDAYFKDGKYLEAQISYSRALQIDPRYVVAHYKSAQCSERLGN